MHVNQLKMKLHSSKYIWWNNFFNHCTFGFGYCLHIQIWFLNVELYPYELEDSCLKEDICYHAREYTKGKGRKQKRIGISYCSGFYIKMSSYWFDSFFILLKTSKFEISYFLYDFGCFWFSILTDICAPLLSYYMIT